MFRPRARTLGVCLLLIAAFAVALLARGAPGGTTVAEAPPPTPAPGPVGAAGAALTDRTVVDSAPPARPRRMIVPDVEVVVNIPSGRLILLEGDSVVRSYPVSVGSARYPTPVGGYLLATVIWNPWWNPPPESSWARNRKPVPPGPGNPMGRVKLHMDELIYIHGTTSEGRLGAPASHGCIRMSNPDVVDLARRLHLYAAPDADGTELDALSAPGKRERRTVMARSVRMRVTYRVAEVRGDRLHVFPDVYGKVGAGFAGQVRRELAGAGFDTAQLTPAAMARLRSSAARGGASFALADVPSLRPEPPAPPRERERGPRLLGTPVVHPEPAPPPRLLGTPVVQPAAPPATVVPDGPAADPS